MLYGKIIDGKWESYWTRKYTENQMLTAGGT